ncbi:MAG: S-adenosylmethionine:tRNA ribosyltransferase-isomerase, partial [Clostridia bacterium]|nr:S-adenosylmethionine:tRNA ribosyltransferase-isomerase [Clostridia bacterium]
MTELKTSDFFYNLPEELIAQTPADPRDSSRMLVYNRANDTISHEHFYNIIDHLHKGDLLVINNTRVIPARIFGHMEGKQTTFEILLLKRLD